MSNESLPTCLVNLGAFVVIPACGQMYHQVTKSTKDHQALHELSTL